MGLLYHFISNRYANIRAISTAYDLMPFYFGVNRGRIWWKGGVHYRRYRYSVVAIISLWWKITFYYFIKNTFMYLEVKMGCLILLIILLGGFFIFFLYAKSPILVLIIVAASMALIALLLRSEIIKHKKLKEYLKKNQAKKD